MVAQRHRIVAQELHALEIWLGILRVALRDAGVHIATIEQQHMAACGFDFCTLRVNQRFTGREAVFAIVVFPKSTMVVVGVQNRELDRAADWIERWA